MTRKTAIYTVQAGGRDTGKVFHLCEMPADQAEKWAIRALLALGRAGIDLPPGSEREGIAAIARAGLDALIRVNFGDAEPLLDEMMESCVEIAPGGERGARLNWTEAKRSIEEVATIVQLRREVFRLHTGF